MSLDQLIQEASALSLEDRRKLIGHLVQLGQAQPSGYWERIEARIEDRNPAHWATLADLQRVVSGGSES